MSTRLFTPPALCAAAATLLLTACGFGPRALEPGTAGFYHAAALETWKSGDYLKTLNDLSSITGSNNQFAEKARPWEIVTAAGIARGYEDLADAWEAGMRSNPAGRTDMRRQIGTYRANADTAIMALAETWQKFAAANRQQEIQLVFAWPAGNPSAPSQLVLVRKGSGLNQGTLVEGAMLQRGVVLAVAQSTGSGEDPARAQTLFQQPLPTVSAADFETGVAECMYELAALYEPTKLDMPHRRDMLYNFALDAVKRHPENRDAAVLADKIQRAIRNAA